MCDYIGLIHKDADSHFRVSFPDFPGVITAGTTLDDARAMAEEALALLLEGLAEDGEAVPEPSVLDEVMSSLFIVDGREPVKLIKSILPAIKKIGGIAEVGRLGIKAANAV